MSIAGGALTIAGSVMTGLSATCRNSCQPVTGSREADLGISIGVLIAGIVLLDEQSDDPFTFAEISEAKAAEIGLTSDELSAYNDSLDEMNAIQQTVVKASFSVEKSQLDEKQAHDLWTQHCSALGDASCSAAKKVSDFIVKSAQAQSKK